MMLMKIMNPIAVERCQHRLRRVYQNKVHTLLVTFVNSIGVLRSVWLILHS